MKVITAQEALDGYATYAVVTDSGKTYGLYLNVDVAKRVAETMCERHGEGTYEVAVIA